MQRHSTNQDSVRRLANMAGVCRSSREAAFISTTDIKKLKEKKKDLQYIKPAEFDALHGCVSDDIYYGTFLLILFYMGFRVGECRALCWEQIDFQNNTISNDAHVVDKGGKRREDGRKNNIDYVAYCL